MSEETVVCNTFKSVLSVFYKTVTGPNSVILMIKINDYYNKEKFQFGGGIGRKKREKKICKPGKINSSVENILNSKVFSYVS